VGSLKNTFHHHPKKHAAVFHAAASQHLPAGDHDGRAFVWMLIMMTLNN
jgi:hypothetical protein